MDKDEQKLRDLLNGAYANEPVNVPDIGEEWKRFEPRYFGKRHKRTFWLFFAALFFSIGGLAYYLSDKSHPGDKLVRTELPLQKEETSAGNLTKDSKAHSEIAQEQKGDTAASNIELTGPNARTDVTTSLKTPEKDIKEVKSSGHRYHVTEVKDMAVAGKPGVIGSAIHTGKIESLSGSEEQMHGPIDDQPEKTPEDKLSVTTNDTIELEKKDTPVLKADTAIASPKFAKGMARKPRFSVGLNNQFRFRSNKFFNPEIIANAHYRIGDFGFRTGLGIGFTHLNEYAYSRVRSDFDSINLVRTKDSTAGNLVSSAYLIIPLYAELRFEHVFASFGANILLPLRNTFEAHTYSSETSAIRPASTDSVINVSTVTENHYKFTPTIQLACQLGYSLGHFDISLGIRQPIYSGLRRLDLTSAHFTRSRMNLSLGLAYRF